MTLVWLTLDKCKNCGNPKQQHLSKIEGLYLCFKLSGGLIIKTGSSFVPVRVATEESVIAERKELGLLIKNSIRRAESTWNRLSKKDLEHIRAVNPNVTQSEWDAIDGREAWRYALLEFDKLASRLVVRGLETKGDKK
jgi:hypothetical protein